MLLGSAPVSAHAQAWKAFETAFPLGLYEVVAFFVAWVVFGSAAFTPTERLPSWMQGLPRLDFAWHPVAFTVMIALLVLYIRFIKGRSIACLGLRSSGIGGDLIWTAKAALALIPVYVVLGALGVGGVYIFANEPTELLKQVIRGAGFSDLSASNLLRVLLFYPVFEEIWYRGLLYTPLRRERGRVVAIVLTALIFGFMHGYYPVTQLIGGVIFGIAYEARRGLIPSILLHIAGNSSLALVALSAPHVSWLN